MIPAEAVEAAAKAWLSHTLRPGNLTLEDGMREILEAAAPYMITRVTNAVINRAYEDGRRAALQEAADEMAAVIALGDVAECAAPVPGEQGRQSAVACRDELYEDPESWLRKYSERPAL